jgi:hypothetical protein
MLISLLAQVTKVSIDHRKRRQERNHFDKSHHLAGQTDHRTVGQSIVWSSDVNLRPDYGIIYNRIVSQVSCSSVPSSLV